MTPPPRPATMVIDMSALVTLAKGDLLGPLSALRVEFRMTDYMKGAELPCALDRHPYFKLSTEALTSEDMRASLEIAVANVGLSIADASAYVAARRLRMPLLTRDGRSSRLSAANGVERFDLAWCMDALDADTSNLPALVAGIARMTELGETGADIRVLQLRKERYEAMIDALARMGRRERGAKSRKVPIRVRTKGEPETA